MREKYIMACDLGTSATKSSIIDMGGCVQGTAQQTYHVEYPKERWAEQDPAVYWDAITTTTREIINQTKIDPQKIKAFTVDAMMASVIPVDAKGRPLRKTILWLDVRSVDYVTPLMNQFSIPDMLAKNIIPVVSAKDPLPKVLWVKEEEPHIFKKAAKFVDVKDWILFQCGIGDFYTDWSHACLWNYFRVDNHTPEWEIVEEGLGLSKDHFSTISKTTDILGTLSPEAAKQLGLTPETQVVCGCGDMVAVPIGSGALKPKEPHLYIGSSGWIAQHQDEPQFDLAGAGTVESAIPGRLLLTGHMESAGSCLAWLVDNVCTSEIEEATTKDCDVYDLVTEKASQVPPGSRNLLYLPWPIGERCPFINPFVRSAFLNLSFDHNRAHMVRAVLEGVAYNTRWVKEILEGMGHTITKLNMCGGGAKSDLWMQIFADILNIPLRRVTTLQDAGTVGVALVAAVALGEFKSFTDLERIFTYDREVEPVPEQVATYDKLYKAFRDIFDQFSGVCYQLNT
ncbi:MAG: FGGY-family carbohydrate kinase [Promethearchaeota archaeon]